MSVIHPGNTCHTVPDDCLSLHQCYQSDFRILYGHALSTACAQHLSPSFSFKAALEGEKNYHFDDTTARVTPAQYLLLNSGQTYACEVDNPAGTRLLSVSFGHKMTCHLLWCLKEKDEILLENIGRWQSQPVYFFEKTYRYSIMLHYLKNRVVAFLAERNACRLELESLLYNFLSALLRQHNRERLHIGRIGVKKASTRQECYKRLCYAIDYLQARYADNNISMDTLGAVARLSPAHLGRLFKELFRTSPYQYLKDIRLEKAGEFLKTTSRPVSEIVRLTGYIDNSSFIRSFKNKYGMTPEAFRLQGTIQKAGLERPAL